MLYIVQMKEEKLICSLQRNIVSYSIIFSIKNYRELNLQESFP